MATGNKGGRPPRAPGERMTRLSVMLRPMFREALEILAREQNTSISRAVESVLTNALRNTSVDGTSVLQLGAEMASVDDSGKGRLRRIELIPASLRTPDERFIASMLSEIGDYSKLKEEEALILFEVAFDMSVTGGGLEFAMSVWREACKAWRAKQDTFRVEDENGIVYTYDLKIGPPQKEGFQLVKTSRDALLRPLAIVQGIIEREQSAPKHGPVPLPRKARPKKT